MIEGKFKASHFVPEVSEVFRISVPICVTLLKKINCDLTIELMNVKVNAIILF